MCCSCCTLTRANVSVRLQAYLSLQVCCRAEWFCRFLFCRYKSTCTAPTVVPYRHDFIFHFPLHSCSAVQQGPLEVSWYYKSYVTSMPPVHLNWHQLCTEHNGKTVRYKQVQCGPAKQCRTTSWTPCMTSRHCSLGKPCLRFTASFSVWARWPQSLSDVHPQSQTSAVPLMLCFCRSHTHWFNLFKLETPHHTRKLTDLTAVPSCLIVRGRCCQFFHLRCLLCSLWSTQAGDRRTNPLA